ncbi:MAG: hypothetical protein NXH85_06340 [Pseudomonadaceae bacterium]|nr:hypothetical protein [Pseudomonadaceae bacterium]
MDLSDAPAPLEQFAQERANAFAAGDAMAAVCTAASLGDRARLDIRTLVLRDLAPGLGLFANRTSVTADKWAFWLRAVFAVQTYWPSQHVQYRMQCRAEELGQELVARSWLQRPDAPKRMDWLYERYPQSSVIASREALVRALDEVADDQTAIAPQSARGLRLTPIEIERLFLGTDNGVHERTRYTLQEGKWQTETLIP